MAKGLCSTCRTAPARTNQRTCRECHAAYVRAHRPKYSELSDEQRRRAYCRHHANMLQLRGILEPLPCEVCGEAKVEKHHTDYSKPALVRWLCRPHHKAVERGEVVLSEQVPVALTERSYFYVTARPSAVPGGVFVRPV